MNQPLIHAHDVFDLIGSFQEGIIPDELRRVTSEHFGSNRFTNCGGMEFDFDGFLVFVPERKKVVQQDGKLMLTRRGRASRERS